MITLHDYLEAEREHDVREAKLGWTIHATVYTVVNAGLVLLNVLLVLFTAEKFFWFPFPLVCWGIGLGIHYLFAVRWGDRQVQHHQTEVEHLAERRAA
ncbi:MAG TPA: 2TM domain-containing protein [Nocardioidaceae bacterium]|nr:2TM domain-containing protein [Nocardioidaceae bacterium]